MYEKDEDLSAIMLDAFENRIKYIDMGRRQWIIIIVKRLMRLKLKE